MWAWYHVVSLVGRHAGLLVSQKWLLAISECQNFPGGACPQTPLSCSHLSTYNGCTSLNQLAPALKCDVDSYQLRSAHCLVAAVRAANECPDCATWGSWKGDGPYNKLSSERQVETCLWYTYRNVLTGFTLCIIYLVSTSTGMDSISLVNCLPQKLNPQKCTGIRKVNNLNKPFSSI